MDSPEQFVKDVTGADKYYLDNLDNDLIIGLFQIWDFLPIPKEPIIPAVEILHSRLISNSDRIVKDINDVIDGNKTCLDEASLQSLHYILEVEEPWTENLIRSTFLKDYVEIPPGTQELIQKLKQTPRC